MKNFYLNIYKPSLANLKIAKKYIESNNIIGIPTETVYGLAGNAYSDKSVTKIFTLKIPLIGYFQLKNLLMAILAASYCGLNQKKILVIDVSFHKVQTIMMIKGVEIQV